MYEMDKQTTEKDALVAEILRHGHSGFVSSREGWVGCECGEKLYLPSGLTFDGYAGDMDEEDVARATHLAAALRASGGIPPGACGICGGPLDKVGTSRCYEAHGVIPPGQTETVPVVRGWVIHPDGSRSTVQRWVKAADGDWVSLDSERRATGDIFMDLEPPSGSSTPPADGGGA